MPRYVSLIRWLILFVVFTFIGATLNIQAAPLPQTTGPEVGSPRDRALENLPRLPGAETQSNSAASVNAIALYSGTRLVFQSIRDNNWEIYLGNDDGSGQTRLTFDGNSDVHPRFNRGATRIVFASKRTGNYEIYTMNVDGSGLTQLTSNNADDIQPYWSPDGSKIAFQSYRDGQSEVYVMNADGSGQTRLTTNSDYDGEPAWSPNGAKIAFVSKRSSSSTAYYIWVMNANGSNQTQLTTQEYSEGPVWSPDGTKIAYDASGSDYWQNLWVVNADGSNPHVVFDESGYVDAWARSWSPDGRYIAFTRIYYTISNNQLYWTNAYLDAWDSTTSNVVRLSSNGLDWRPDWQLADGTAPSSSVNALRTVSPGPVTVRWSGSDSGGSGLANFDIQVKDGANGVWTMWQSATTATSASYPGVGGHTYYFRSRARDNAGNVESWPATYDATTTVEALAPISAVEPLPQFSKDSVTVTWSGNDPGGSGIQTYDVQYRDVTTGSQWMAWQTSVSTTIASFAGTIGHTYAFRSRALDRAQNQEALHSDNGDTQTTFYAWAISGQAHDNTGTPLVGVNVTTVPQAQGVLAINPKGQYAAYVITSSNTYTASWSKNGYSSLPATAFNGSINSSALYQGTIPAQGNIVTVNGLVVGQTYRIVISGTFEFALGGGSWHDAQWTTWSCPPMVLCTYSKAVSFNGVLLAAQNSQDAVDPNHEYTFLWTANMPQLQMYIVDSDYRDNSGYLTYEILSEVPDASTGDSTIAQIVTVPLTMTTPILSFLYQSGSFSSLENGLVSYWKLDEASGDALDALGTNTLPAVNAPGSATGIVSTARTFSGDHQYFSIPTKPSVEVGNTSFTFTAWVNLANKTDNHGFVGKQIENYPTYDRDYSLYYDKDFDRLIFQVAGPDGVTLTRAIANSSGSPMTNTWYFLAGGYDYANGYIWISVNGGLKETTPFTGSVHVGQAPFMLGGVDNPSFGYHAGLLDEVGFWKRSLTSAEITALYNNGQGQSYPFADQGNAIDAKLDIFLPPADNLVRNGNFEASDLATGGWSTSGAITPVLTSTVRHTGRQSILLGTTANGSINSLALYQGTIPAQGNIVTVNGLVVGQTYRIVISGTFEFALGGGSWHDAQWTTWSCPPMVLCTYSKAVSFNGVLLAAQNSQDAVDPNHEYTFLWTANMPQLQMYIVDSDYRDNSGYLTYEILSEVPDASTGDSTIAQIVTVPLTMTTPILSFLYQSGSFSSLENGLVSYWKLDEASGDALDALGTNTLPAVNAPGSATGIVSTARTFSGDHQYFSIPTKPSVEVGNTSFTFTAWVNLANKTDNHGFVGKQIENYPTYDRDYSLYYDKDFDRLIFQVAGPDGVTLTRAIANSSGSPMTNTWYFLAGGYDYANGYIWISVNGGLKETTPFTGSVHVGQAPFMLGGVDNPSFGYHAGLLDEVGFWKRSLTSAEITALYNNGQGQLRNGLVSYWKLDETSGEAVDTLGTNILPAYNAPGSAAGVISTARTFSGDHQYFSIPTKPSVEVGNTSFTFTAWVNLSNKTDNHAFVGKQIENYPTYNRDYSLYYDKDFDRLIFQVAGPDGVTLTRAIANSSGSPMTNTWYFLAGGYDLTNGYIWISVNGGLKETTPFTGSVHVGQAPFMLGGVDNPSFGYHAGLLDEVGFWKRSLTPAEITALYNNGQGQSYPFATQGNTFDVRVDNGITNTTVFTAGLDATDWTHHWLDLSSWKGQTITVAFSLHQNTADSPAWVYLDEVSLGSGHPDVWVQLANPPTARPSSSVTYQLTYGNQGGVPASNSQLMVTFPAQLTFVEASIPPITTTPALVWNLGDLPAQSGPSTILITTTVTPTITGIPVVSNTVNIATTATELEMANNAQQTSMTIKYDVFLPIIALE